MAQIVKLKRTSLSGKVPTVSNIELGELAMNTYDGRIFFEKNDGSATVQEILTTNAGRAITGSININGAITASYFKGDGSALTNIQATVSEQVTVTSSFESESTIDVAHNFSSKNVIVSVYDSNDNQIIPQTVNLTDTDNVRVVLSSAQSGFVVVAKGGHIVSGSADDSNRLNGQLASYYLNYNNFTNVPSGLVSGSAQVDYNSIQNKLSVGDGGLTQNNFTNTLKSKLDGIESSATADQTGAEIKTALFNESDTNNLTDSLLSKLNAIEASADVTDAGNVVPILNSNTVISGSSQVSIGSTTGTLAVNKGGTGATTAAGARTNLGVDAAGTDNSTDVTLGGSYDYITISGQTITRNQVDASTDISNLTTSNVSEGTNQYYTDARVKTKLNTEAVLSGSSHSGDQTFDDNVIITGNLTVSGTTTSVNSNTVNIGDNIIVLNSDESGTPSQDGGIEIERGTSTNVRFQFKESTDRWQFSNDGSTYFNLPTSTADVAEFSNLYYTDTRVKTKLNTEGVISGSSQVDHDATTNFVANEHIDHSQITVGSGKGLSGGGTINVSRSLTLNTGSAHFSSGVVESLPAGTVSGSSQIDVTSTTNYVAPAITDNSGTPTLVSGITAAEVRSAIGVDASGTDNSTDVTLANTNYLSLSGQQLTGGTVPIGSGGTGATSAGAARTALGVDAAGTDNSTDVTLAGSYDYLSISGQEITLGQVDYSTDIANTPTTITGAQITKLGHISVSQAVNLDTMESNISTNNSKVGYTDSLVKTKLNADTVISGSSQITDLTTYKETVSGASSYALTHNLNEQYPIVQCWDTSTSQQVQASDVTSNSANQVTVDFATNFAGVIIVKK